MRVNKIKFFTFLFFIFFSSLQPAASKSPEGMIKVPSGQFYMGRNNPQKDDEGPRHLVRISSFYIDQTLVTNSEFKKFIENYKYITDATKNGYGMVGLEGLKNWLWTKVPSANWEQPFGAEKKEDLPIKNDYPVVSVSWNDANAYCKSVGKRLPTEAEWEYAARAGKGDRIFPWGNNPNLKNGKPGLNYWQGPSHIKNEDIDGYKYMSPVKAFPPNAWGLYDPVGNVWQWVSDWYDAGYFKKISSIKGVLNPTGPESGTQKVARGGSWWCSPTTCSGFGLYFRGKNRPNAVYNNNGFRCARDL